ncbi:hypothetical protein [Pseudomonas nitroreducens]|uniref:hypothetical protein n=1 Tax=Pseudomonas nitroreducens TaxID=46680 RepID=UPI0018736D87|nr:hypothetical protein [Pseudomonas nitritireducens]
MGVPTAWRRVSARDDAADKRFFRLYLLVFIINLLIGSEGMSAKQEALAENAGFLD